MLPRASWLVLSSSPPESFDESLDSSSWRPFSGPIGRLRSGGPRMRLSSHVLRLSSYVLQEAQSGAEPGGSAIYSVEHSPVLDLRWPGRRVEFGYESNFLGSSEI